MSGQDIAAAILAEAERIEREKQGQALTADEIKAVKAADFLRKIAPYLVTPPADEGDK